MASSLPSISIPNMESVRQDYGTARPIVEDFLRETDISTLADLTAQDLNSLYDDLAWPHDDQEVKRKRNLIAWIRRHYQELDIQPLPLTQLLRDSMQLRKLSPMTDKETSSTNLALPMQELRELQPTRNSVKPNFGPEFFAMIEQSARPSTRQLRSSVQTVTPQPIRPSPAPITMPKRPEPDTKIEHRPWQSTTPSTERMIKPKVEFSPWMSLVDDIEEYEEDPLRRSRTSSPLFMPITDPPTPRTPHGTPIPSALASPFQRTIPTMAVKLTPAESPIAPPRRDQRSPIPQPQAVRPETPNTAVGETTFRSTVETKARKQHFRPSPQLQTSLNDCLTLVHGAFVAEDFDAAIMGLSDAIARVLLEKRDSKCTHV